MRVEVGALITRVPLEDFQNCQYAFWHLDSHGVQYYLPALMVATLKNQDVGNYNEDFFWSMFDLASERMALLNDAQREVVAEFLTLPASPLSRKHETKTE